VLPHLEAQGISARAVIWDDPAVDWSRYTLCVVRSTWNYHRKRGEFLAWAERVSRVTALWNPPEVLRWNTHKSYLRDLEQRGVPVVPTKWLTAGSRANLETLMSVHGWESAVVKPTVSASAEDTLLITSTTVDEGQSLLNTLLPRRDMMVQPFIASVQTERERSYMFIDGEFTHAVRRPFALAQEGYDAWRVKPFQPSAKEISFAQRALRAARHVTLYARVDLVSDEAGDLRVMELELVEPSLFFAQSPRAAEQLARAIVARSST
jgi:glutathione synthase/RimK-type ligase-like ATP-grasp enzyme